MDADEVTEIRGLLGSEAGRLTLRARAFVQLGRAFTSALSADDYRSALAALDQQAKLLGLYAPSRGVARAGEEDLSRLSDAELGERRAQAEARILSEREDEG